MSPLDWLLALFTLLQMDAELLPALPRSHAVFFVRQLFLQVAHVPRVDPGRPDAYAADRRAALDHVALLACVLNQLLAAAVAPQNCAEAVWHATRMAIDGRLVPHPTTSRNRTFDPAIERAIADNRPDRAARLMRRLYYPSPVGRVAGGAVVVLLLGLSALRFAF